MAGVTGVAEFHQACSGCILAGLAEDKKEQKEAELGRDLPDKGSQEAQAWIGKELEQQLQSLEDCKGKHL